MTLDEFFHRLSAVKDNYEWFIDDQYKQYGLYEIRGKCKLEGNCEEGYCPIEAVDGKRGDIWNAGLSTDNAQIVVASADHRFPTQNLEYSEICAQARTKILQILNLSEHKDLPKGEQSEP